MIRAVGTGPRQMPPVLMYEEVLSPDELARARSLRATFQKNMAWASANAVEINRTCRGKFICVAGEQLFAADSPKQAHALAVAAHPAEDAATYSCFVPTTDRPKIYAN